MIRDLVCSALSVDPELWPQLERLLDAGLDTPPGERQTWLESLDPRYEPLALVAAG